MALRGFILPLPPLVTFKPCNRFVALRNRFIVAASRARIGFYVLGASGALVKSWQGPRGESHWFRLLRDLGFSHGKGESNTAKTARVNNIVSTASQSQAAGFQSN